MCYTFKCRGCLKFVVVVIVIIVVVVVAVKPTLFLSVLEMKMRTGVINSHR